MYAYFNGELTEIGSDAVIIEVSGIGYNINMPSADISVLPPIGSVVKVYTYTNVKEDELSLYGFLSKDELGLFKHLISVSGIGPKGAMSILSYLGTNGLIKAILMSDGKAISKAPGVGAKTAERVIIDLKDKVGKEYSGVPGSGDVSDINASGTSERAFISGGLSDEEKDAILALTSLGYTEKNAKNAVISVINDERAADPDKVLKSDEILKKALFYL